MTSGSRAWQTRVRAEDRATIRRLQRILLRCLTQINAQNVNQLEVAWVHHSGDVSDGTGAVTKTSFQVTPIVANDTLYYCTGFNRVFALDPETGTERWSFDPELRGTRLSGPYPLTCRGVAYWEGSDPADVGACSKRILTGTLDSQLIAIDADSGHVCSWWAISS